MDGISSVFLQLGVDGSFFYQLGTFLLLFILSKIFFFNKLFEVIDERQTQKVKLETELRSKLHKVDHAKNQYEHRVSEARQNSQKLYQDKRKNVVSTWQEKVNTEEVKFQKEIEHDRDEFKKELEDKRIKNMMSVDDLANKLVDQIAKH